MSEFLAIGVKLFSDHCKEQGAPVRQGGHAASGLSSSLWREPALDNLLSDPTLEPLLARDGVTRDELHQTIEAARRTLA